MRPRIDQAAFVLLELLAAAAVFGLLLLCAPPRLSALRSRCALRDAAAQIIDTLEEQGTLALLRREKTAIQFELQSGAILTAQSGNGGPVLMTMPRGITVVRSRFLAGGTTIVFQPTGSASPGSVVIADAFGRRCTITQSLWGRRRASCL